VRLFEGQLAPIACATRKEPEACSMSVGCSLREVWEDARDALLERLSTTTFADLAQGAGGPWCEGRGAVNGDIVST
jgi:DNA-binding IscR family transcriptional regulator